MELFPATPQPFSPGAGGARAPCEPICGGARSATVGVRSSSMPRSSESTSAAQGSVVAQQPFYLYTTPALDHSWLSSCERYAVLRNSVNDSNTAEVGVHNVLQRHAMRTHDPAAASLFYVPIFEYVSYYIGDCNGTTHRGRMEAATVALRSSAAFQRHGGADHFFATSAWSISGSKELSLRAQELIHPHTSSTLHTRVHSTGTPCTAHSLALSHCVAHLRAREWQRVA